MGEWRGWVRINRFLRVSDGRSMCAVHSRDLRKEGRRKEEEEEDWDFLID